MMKQNSNTKQNTINHTRKKFKSSTTELKLFKLESWFSERLENDVMELSHCIWILASDSYRDNSPIQTNKKEFSLGKGDQEGVEVNILFVRRERLNSIIKGVLVYVT